MVKWEFEPTDSVDGWERTDVLSFIFLLFSFFFFFYLQFFRVGSSSWTDPSSIHFLKFFLLRGVGKLCQLFQEFQEFQECPTAALFNTGKATEINNFSTVRKMNFVERNATDNPVQKYPAKQLTISSQTAENVPRFESRVDE